MAATIDLPTKIRDEPFHRDVPTRDIPTIRYIPTRDVPTKIRDIPTNEFYKHKHKQKYKQRTSQAEVQAEGEEQASSTSRRKNSSDVIRYYFLSNLWNGTVHPS